MITLGKQVRDKASGFEGIVTARIEYINGCIQYCVKPRVGADGKPPDSLYLDEEFLEVIGNGIAIAPRPGGGPAPAGLPTSYRG